MATFAKLVEDQTLLEVKVRLGTGQFYDRKLHTFSGPLSWMRSQVPRMSTGRINSAQTPAEQLMQRLIQWLSGDHMQEGPMFAELRYPSGHDVWELKTPDLRMFGWMYEPKHLIIASCGFADDYKEPTKTKNYAGEVRFVSGVRDALNLDEPKLVRGRFNDLV